MHKDAKPSGSLPWRLGTGNRMESALKRQPVCFSLHSVGEGALPRAPPAKSARVMQAIFWIIEAKDLCGHQMLRRVSERSILETVF